MINNEQFCKFDNRFVKMKKPDTSKITRREFLKAGGAVAAGAAIVGSAEASSHAKPTPTSKGIDYDKMVHSVCNYCGVGCGLEIYVKDGKVVHVQGDPENPINNGSLCSKGSSHIQLINNDFRVKEPMKRTGNGDWQKISWKEAINLVADKITETKSNHGADAIAFMGSAAVLNEEAYLFHKITRTLGLKNVELQCTECHITAKKGMKNSYGTGATSNNWIDMQNTKCALIVGTNLVETHPIAFQHITIAREENGAKIIVIDPRCTKTAVKADIHLQVRPGTDIALINSIIRYVINTEGYDERYLMENTVAPFIVDRDKKAFVLETETKLVEKKDENGNPILDGEGNPVMEEVEVEIKGGYKKADSLEGHPDTAFNILKEIVAPYTFQEAGKITWVPADDIKKAADTIIECSQGMGKKGVKNCVAVSSSTGLSQHTTGLQNARSIGILQLLLGNMGRPGGGHAVANGHNPGAVRMSATPHDFAVKLPIREDGESWKKYFGRLTGGWTAKDEEEPTDYDEFVKDITKPVGKDLRKGKWMKYNSCCSQRRGILAVLNRWCIRPDQMVTGHGHDVVEMFRAMKTREIKTLWAFAENPAVANPNAKDTREGLKNLDVLIVSDIFESETASVERKPDGITILLPGCPFAEKTGSHDNTSRIIQWCEQAIDPQYKSKSDLEVVLRVAKRLSDNGALLYDENVANSAWEGAWTQYGFDPDSDPDRDALTGEELDKVVTEVYKETDMCNRMYRGQYDWDTIKVLAKRRDTTPGALETEFSEWAWCWPMNERMLYPDGAFMTPEKKGLIYAPKASGGPLPVHEEPVETPMPELTEYENKTNVIHDLITGTKDEYPVVLTTHRVLEQYQAGQKSRNNPWLCELEPEPHCMMGSTLADKLGVNDGDDVRVSTARGSIVVKAKIDGRMDHWKGDKQVVSISWQWGGKGLSKGASGNLLTIDATAPAGMPEYKACLCKVEKA
ncbi:MAG: hypothetical protein A7316_09700 [Candidatus Altiarchaeales archaeon WOR_SM1_86-2]|nr:MAG: hypothetical protein A7316_09700 [Candidatus Altiarchaeales archaeon WOR_SM1_86-2]